MSVKLRLRRIGRKKRPVWAVVATDSRKARNGRYIEDLGRYYPLEQPARVRIDEQRVMYWLEQGARPSDTVRSMLSKRGLMLAMDLRRQGKSEDEIREAVEAHREMRAEKGEAVKTTAEDRREAALEAERERVKELEKEEAERRRKEEERKRREAEAKKAKEEEEAKESDEAEEKDVETQRAASEEDTEADEEAEAKAEAKAEEADESGEAEAEDVETQRAASEEEAKDEGGEDEEEEEKS